MVWWLALLPYSKKVPGWNPIGALVLKVYVHRFSQRIPASSYHLKTCIRLIGDCILTLRVTVNVHGCLSQLSLCWPYDGLAAHPGCTPASCPVAGG